MFVSISSDYKEKPVYEKKILGKYLLKNEDFEKTEILLLWRKLADKDYLSKFKNLKAVVRYGTGYDNVDISFLKTNNIKLFNNPDYCLEEVSDTVIALVLSRMRRLKQYDEISKNIMSSPNKYLFKNTIDDIERISDKNFGVLGAGSIGQMVLKKSSVFFKNIGFFDPYIKKNRNLLKYKNFKDLNDFLKWSDVISINANLNLSNRHMINKKFINSVKKNVIIINLARFEFIENIELIFDALKNRKIDYFAIDLEMRDIIKQRIKISNFINLYPNYISIHPHSSFYSKQSYIAMRSNTAEIALKIINKKKIKSRVL